MDPTIDTAADPSASASSHGWQKVTYPKRHRRAQPPPPVHHHAGPTANGTSHVFDSLEIKAEERRRAIEAAAAAAAESYATPAVAASRSDDDDEDEAFGAGADAAGSEKPKKPKEKKPKKPKITVAEAAAKIDADDLAAFLLEIAGSYEAQQDIELMRFADYFGRAFAVVGSSQFPWAKLFKESTVSKIIDVPLCHISDPVYKTSVDWIAKKSAESLGDFVLWCLDCILADLASQQTAAKGSKKPVQQSPSKAQMTGSRSNVLPAMGRRTANH